MNIQRIRAMNDEELKTYLSKLSDRKSNNCIKCGKEAIYAFFVKNRKAEQQKNYVLYVKNVIKKHLKK